VSVRYPGYKIVQRHGLAQVLNQTVRPGQGTPGDLTSDSGI